MALVIALTALIGMTAASWMRIHEVVTERNGLLTDRINGTAHSFSRELRGRLELADTLVRYLTAADGGPGGALLRERMLSADAFHGVALLPFNESAHDGGEQPDAIAALSSIEPGDRLKLKAGQSLLEIATPEPGRTVIYLVHQVNAAGVPQLGLLNSIRPGCGRERRSCRIRIQSW